MLKITVTHSATGRQPCSIIRPKTSCTFFLGHKSVKNTMFYIQLEQAIFKEASDDFVTRVTRSVKGARSLVEAGFECVLEMNGLRLFRKRK